MCIFIYAFIYAFIYIHIYIYISWYTHIDGLTLMLVAYGNGGIGNIVYVEVVIEIVLNTVKI